MAQTPVSPALTDQMLATQLFAGLPADEVLRIAAAAHSRRLAAGEYYFLQGDPAERGWGLALCRVVCERRGGSVSVTRAGDRRTVFTAVVPTDREVLS